MAAPLAVSILRDETRLAHTPVTLTPLTQPIALASHSTDSTSEDVRAFWRHLPNAIMTHLPVGKLMTLPNNAPILGRRDLGSALYVREVYDRAYDKMKMKLATAHRKGILLLGTPGTGQEQHQQHRQRIHSGMASAMCSLVPFDVPMMCVCCSNVGNSVMACALMWRLIQDHPTASIVYVDHSRAFDKYICFTPGCDPRSSNMIDTFCEEILEESNFIIFDVSEKGTPVPAVGIHAQHILLSSVHTSQPAYGTWYQNHPLRLVLPMWSFEEIVEARKHIYTDRKLNDYDMRYRTLGGVPRYIFATDVSFKEILQRFKEGMPNTKEIKLILEEIEWYRHCRSIGLISEKGARLLTYEVDEELEIVKIRWVSDQIAAWTMERLQP